MIKNKQKCCKKAKSLHFGQKAWQNGAFLIAAFNENHGFGDFRVSVIYYCPFFALLKPIRSERNGPKQNQPNCQFVCFVQFMQHK